MRAGGRGGRQGPRGDPVPPRALLAFMGRLCARAPFRARGVLCEGFFLARRFPMRGPFCALGDNEWL